MTNHRIHILLIDDDADLVEDIVPVMKNYGLEVLFLGSSQEASRISSLLGKTINKVKLILLDLKMPCLEEIDQNESEYDGLTGLFLYDKYIKPIFPQTPVIILTAMRSIEKMNSVRFEPNIKKVLYKPIYPDDLAKVIINEVARTKKNNLPFL
jgi:CheY-like chemotaxis protein